MQLTGGEAVLLQLVDLAVPLESANCVSALLPKFICTSPTVSPPTVRLLNVTLLTGGVRTPLPLNVKEVPVFCHATCVPVALGLL